MKKRLHDKKAGIAILISLIIISLAEIVIRAVYLRDMINATGNYGEQIIAVIFVAISFYTIVAMFKDDTGLSTAKGSHFIAQGTLDSMIVFTKADLALGTITGFIFAGDDTLQYCMFENLVPKTPLIRVEGTRAQFNLENSIIKETGASNTSYLLSTNSAATITIKGCNIYNNHYSYLVYAIQTEMRCNICNNNINKNNINLEYLLNIFATTI